MGVYDIKYINSKGESINLSKYPYFIDVEPLFEYRWDSVLTPYQNGKGSRLNSFVRESANIQTQIAYFGNAKETAKAFNDLFSVFEYDVRKSTAGRLYINDTYIECYVVSSTAELWGKTLRGGYKDIEILATYPFWITEHQKQFTKDKGSHSSGGLDYNYDYMYDYTPYEAGRTNWIVADETPMNFKLSVYGYANNPQIYINEHSYKVNAPIYDGEYMTIDSKTKSVVKTRNDGEIVNLFDLRDKNASIFEQIMGGKIGVNWADNFTFDLILYEERSEPRWSF